jgi:translation initiation factor IF-2
MEQEKLRNASLLDEQEKKLEEDELCKLDKLFALESGIEPDDYVKQKKAERDSQKPKRIPVILKGDVSGSIEAVTIQIENFPREQLNVLVVKQGVGDVSDTDLKTAASVGEDCVILAFNVNVSANSKSVLNSASNITIKSFQIIHHLVDWLVEFCASKLPSVLSYRDIAHATVKEKFEMKKSGTKLAVAGCLLNSGTLYRGGDVQVRRAGDVIFTGKIRLLRHHKEEVTQIDSGKECGILFTSSFGDFESGDEVVAVETVTKKAQFKVRDYEKAAVNRS